jgi:hypothetical protein
VVYASSSSALATGSALNFDGSALSISATDARSILKLVATTATNPVYSRASNTGGFLYVGMDGSGGSDFGAGAYASAVWSSGAYPMVFGTNGTERMRISSATGGVGAVGIGYSSLTSVGDNGLAVLGNVGIGTSSPVSGYQLTLSGSASAIYFNATGGGTPRNYGIGTNFVAGNGEFTIRDLSAGADRLTISSTGNAGLGVTPSAWNAGKAIQLGTTDPSGIWNPGDGINVISNLYYNSAYLFADTGYALYYQQNTSSGKHIWATSTASGSAGGGATLPQMMTLDASGNLLVGTTAIPAVGVGGTLISSGLSTQPNLKLSFGSFTGSGTYVSFINGNGEVGSISSSGTTTTYATSSDYRLKNSVAPMTGALEKVALLKPCTYKWNVDGLDCQGFIAHELAEVVPDCVVGEKDAVDEDGNPKYQGIDTSFLVATLTAAIQEQQAMIESLRQRLSAANL